MHLGGRGRHRQARADGLFVFGGWGRMAVDTGNPVTEVKLIEPDSTTWFVRPGIENKWCEFGPTEIFASYRHDDPGSNPGKTVSANINFWQAGVIQKFEKAD